MSYRDIEELQRIRDISVDYETIQRWVFKFTLCALHNDVIIPFPKFETAKS